MPKLVKGNRAKGIIQEFLPSSALLLLLSGLKRPYIPIEGSKKQSEDCRYKALLRQMVLHVEIVPDTHISLFLVLLVQVLTQRTRLYHLLHCSVSMT